MQFFCLVHFLLLYYGWFFSHHRPLLFLKAFFRTKEATLLTYLLSRFIPMNIFFLCTDRFFCYLGLLIWKQMECILCFCSTVQIHFGFPKQQYANHIHFFLVKMNWRGVHWFWWPNTHSDFFIILRRPSLLREIMYRPAICDEILSNVGTPNKWCELWSFSRKFVDLI